MPPNSCEWTYQDAEQIWTPSCHCHTGYGSGSGPETKGQFPDATTAQIQTWAAAAGKSVPALQQGATITLPCVLLQTDPG